MGVSYSGGRAVSFAYARLTSAPEVNAAASIAATHSAPTSARPVVDQEGAIGRTSTGVFRIVSDQYTLPFKRSVTVELSERIDIEGVIVKCCGTASYLGGHLPVVSLFFLELDSIEETHAAANERKLLAAVKFPPPPLSHV